MEFPSADDLKGLIAALAPGLIILGIRQAFMAGARPDLKDRVISYAAVSAIYYAVANPAFALFRDRFGLLVWPSDALEYVGLPLLIGGLVALATAQDWASGLWRLVGIQPVHHVPTAWDYLFSRLPDETYILVTLSDGSQVAGLYGEGSFASSNDGERDLLISDVWEVTHGKWTRSETPKSILLCGRDIRTVELFHGDDS